MDGFERRREQKKKNILDAALALFMKQDVHKVSVAEIAEKAKVSQVTIYNYFESKDNLVKQVIKYYVDQVWEEQKELLDNDLSFKEKVKKIIFEKSDIASEIGESFFKEFMSDYSTGKSYVEEIYIKEALPRMIQLFEDGKKQGAIDPSISNEAILVYLQMFKEYIQKEDVGKQLLPLTEDLTKLFFYGIAGKKE